MSDTDSRSDRENSDLSRRNFLRGLGAATVACTAPAWGGQTFMDALGGLFQKHYRKMTPQEVQDALERIERRTLSKTGVEITCENTPAMDVVPTQVGVGNQSCFRSIGILECKQYDGRDGVLHVACRGEMPSNDCFIWLGDPL